MLGADAVAATTLPYDRRAERLPGRAIKHHDRLALVRDAEARNVRDSRSLTSQQCLQGIEGVLPDFLRVVLDPTRLRIMRFVTSRLAIETVPLAVKQQHLRCRCAL